MIIETKAFNQLIFDAFTRKINWLEASSRYPVVDFFDTFLSTRAALRRLLNNLTDAQASYHEPGATTWSISETVTHLVFTQNSFYNAMLDITSIELPHIAEAARGFGEGSKLGVATEELRRALDDATQRIEAAFPLTLALNDPNKIVRNPLFGELNFSAWVLLLAGHEGDHYRQAAVIRRLARAALPG